MVSKLKATNVDLLKTFLDSFRPIKLRERGYYESRNDAICRVPKCLQSTYINNTIKYNSSEQNIINKNKLAHYIYQKDFALILSCDITINEENPEVVYVSLIIQLPQCLSDLH